VDQETHLYYFACMFLWWILSGFDYLFEGIGSIELHRRYREGYTESENLAEWLLDELFSASDCEDISEEEARAVYSKIETFEPLILKWAEEVRAAAYGVGEVCALDKETCLYYFACGWVSRILSEFDHLLKDMSSAELYQRYREAYAKFKSLSKWLQDELSSAGNREGINEGAAKALRAGIERLAEQLATEWREKVRALSRDLNNEP
jgi:hypothetical protein